jgi:hypothetical protein
VAGDRPNDGPAKAGNTQTTRVTARVSEGPAHTRTVRSRRSRFGLGPTAAPALSRSADFAPRTNRRPCGQLGVERWEVSWRSRRWWPDKS